MKQASKLKQIKLWAVILLGTLCFLKSNTISAHIVHYYTLPCFTQGNTVTVNTKITAAGAGTYYHWQYRNAPGGTWTWLANGSNIINGHTFNVTGASQVSGITNYTPNLVIASAGLPLYTTELNNVELRVVMTDGLDPQYNPYPGTPAWGGEEFNNAFEAKHVRLMAKPANENCFSNCSGNILLANPALVPAPLSDYFGGFEMGNGNTTDNFSTPGTYGVTTKCSTDITRCTSLPLGASPMYRILNNPDSINSSFSAFAPHSGKQMMVVSRNNNAANRLWYRTIAVSNAANFYNGHVIFKAWFAKVDATDACMVLEVKGATSENGTVSSFTGNSISQTVTGTAGTWVQVTLNITLPLNTYKKLEFSIHSCNNTVASVAIDDICLIEPAAGALPVVLTPLKSAYVNGISQLTWATEQESNSNYFEIERSNDGNNFYAIGKVNASGYSSKSVTYKFDDAHAGFGINYYRLKLVDKDGHFDYSNTVMVNVNIKGNFVTAVYPGPFTDKININISSENQAMATVRIFDLTGRTIKNQQVQVIKGNSTVIVNNLQNLNKGMYLLEVNINGKKYTEKLLK